MTLVLVCWIVGSALFFAGWLFGVIMARRQLDSADRPSEGFCEACYLRQVAMSIDTGAATWSPYARAERPGTAPAPLDTAV